MVDNCDIRQPYRAFRALDQAHLHGFDWRITPEQFAARYTRADLMDCYNFGLSRLHEITTWLAHHGLYLYGSPKVNMQAESMGLRCPLDEELRRKREEEPSDDSVSGILTKLLTPEIDLRDYFAGQALATAMSPRGGHPVGNGQGAVNRRKMVAEACYAFADAMLEARNA